MNISSKVVNIFCSLFIILTSLTSFGQTLNQDSILANEAADQTLIHFYAHEYNQVEDHAKRAIFYGEKIKDWNVYTMASLRLAKSYWKTGRAEEAIETLETLRPIILKHFAPNESARVALNYQLAKYYASKIEKKDLAIELIKDNIPIIKKGVVFSESWQKRFEVNEKQPKISQINDIAENNRTLGTIFGNNREYDSAIYYMEISKQVFQEILEERPNSNATYLDLIQLLTQYYQKNADYESSQKLILRYRVFLNQNTHITEDQREFYESRFHEVLGVQYASSHEYDLAIEHLNKAWERYTVLQTLGIIYKDLKQLDQSIFYLKKAHYRAKHSTVSYPSDIAIILNELGNVYLEQKKYNESLDYFRQAINVQKKENHETKRNRYYSFMGIGDVYREIEKYPEALKSYQKANDEIIDYPFEKDIYLSTLLTRKGILSTLKKQHTQAFTQFQASLNLLGKNVSLEDWEDLPKEYSTNYPDQLFFALNSKIQTLEKVFKETNDIIYLESEIKHFEYVTNFIEYIRKYEFKNISKIYWIEKANEISHNYIQAVLDYSKLTNQPTYAQKAFSIADQNKAGILREALREVDARRYSHIPEEIIAKEEQIKNEIVWLEKKVFARKSKLSELDSKLDLKIQGWDNKISELKIRHQLLKRQIAKDYSAYFQAKYELAPVQLAETQKSLQESNETLIEYAIADSVIYAFIITKDSYNIQTLPKSDSLERWIIDLREGIYGHWISFERNLASYEYSVQTYSASASKLYATLLKPIFGNRDLPEKLVIVPDGVLGYIPFEVLLTEAPKQIGRFGSYPFLIRKTEISYAFSVKLQLEMYQKNISPTISKILAIAPTFNQAEDLFSSAQKTRQNLLFPLKYNTEEVSYLLKNFDAQMKTNDLATKDQFLKLAPYFRIIHLATHAKVHDKNPRFSYIAFTEMADSLPQANLLYLSEIYNLTLNAEMVVLSACETGIGELQKGEGIISMARSFAYAGSKSIITSLWSVDDRSTADIMKNFYNHLDHEERKSQALRNAKLDYLENHDDEANHPFFWAPMIAMGDMEAVELNDKTNNWSWILGLSVIGLFIVVGFWRKKKKY